MNLIKFAFLCFTVLFFCACDKNNDDNQTPIPEEKPVVVNGVLNVKYFDVSMSPMKLKVVKTPKYAHAIFFNDNGEFVNEKIYDGEFGGTIEYTLLEGDYKFIVFVSDDMALYTVDSSTDLTYAETNVYVNSITADEYLWYDSGEFTVSQNKSEADEATVTSPLGLITIDITNETFSDKWKSIKTRILPMDYTADNSLNTVCALPGNTAYTAGVTSHSEISKTVNTSPEVTVDDLDFSTVLFPYSSKYKVIFEITNSVDNTTTTMVVENIPIVDDENTTLKGKLKETISEVDGSYKITIEDVEIGDGQTIEF